MAETSWYYARNKQKIGPVNYSDLRQLAVSGQVQPADMVLQSGSLKWVQASAVEGLFPTAIAATPPMPRATPAVVQEDGRGMKAEREKAEKVVKASREQQASAREERSKLFPRGGSGWVRVGIGFGAVVGVVGLLFWVVNSIPRSGLVQSQ